MSNKRVFQSDEVTVEFQTTDPLKIPRVGQRKTVRVNGKPEIMYVNAIDVRRRYNSEDSLEAGGDVELYNLYVGAVTFGEYRVD